MEKACIKTHKVVQSDHSYRYYEIDYTIDFETHFGPLQTTEDYNPQYYYPEYGTEPHWKEDLNDEKICNSDVTTTLQQTMRTTP